MSEASDGRVGLYLGVVSLLAVLRSIPRATSARRLIVPVVLPPVTLDWGRGFATMLETGRRS